MEALARLSGVIRRDHDQRLVELALVLERIDDPPDLGVRVLRDEGQVTHLPVRAGRGARLALVLRAPHASLPIGRR